MKYRIELAATAKADIRGQAQWLREQVSPAKDEEGKRDVTDIDRL